MEEILKTPKEWAKETGIEVLDADGWRGAFPRPFDEPISEEEFRFRAETSTIRTTKPVWKETAQEALDAHLNGDSDEDGEES